MMDVITEMRGEAPAMAQAVIERLQGNDADEAEVLLAQMNEAYPETRDFLIFPVTIALLRGRPHDAWQLVNGLPEDRSPELKALCLKMLGDPLWHSYATAHEDSQDPFVRLAMRKLLGSA
ncbi:hypothetical protein FAZ69_32350 [Trinickia terrae]|uniref:Uncharacterized protein n=1 Tax=Trinickia terrae TaxID=2571161 RepID=A0A4V5PH50_9BURK|nr:HrpB1 family type III secretion system apparatus protein [Trinickia terrae]TKC77970.1 hypothetical protein FAZ69_32350 [Trinickia terrae]